MLQRLMALSGAAEVFNNKFNDDGDEWADPVIIEGSPIEEEKYD